MDKELRNTLRNTVTKCRKLLEDAVGELLEGQFGIHRNGNVEDADQLKHLAVEDQDYRFQVLVHYEHIKAAGFKPADAMGQLIREVAFTHLNRLCAYKLMEKRGLIRESVSRGLKSQGVSFHLADHPEDEKLWDGGKQDIAYRHFLESIGARFADEIPILFSPHDPANRLFPPQRVLDEVLELINAQALKDIWTEDETIGWIYQYFTPKELRDQARKESAAPRNSYELAFRNQFFTPRYVVRFLGDNTLGRIWYEMMQGRTRLVEKCEYMVRRPKEIWLKAGEEPPSQEPGTKNQELSQDELLRQPVHIPFRAKKDPRDIKLLDPAEGSGHFLLYGFDLMEVIYLEAWDDPDLGKRLKSDFKSLEAYKRKIPELILRHNLHGIDIDLRAVQIAALALWLRAQRAWQEMDIPADQRPRITKSNLVCAEPMPGEADLLEEFVADLQPRVLGQLVRVVFDKMKLAGEAGSLLKIEEELRDAIAAAKKQWQAGPKKEQMELFGGPAKPRQEELAFDLAGITDEQFWSEAEVRVLTALSDYATKASRNAGYTRRLFAEDAARGFAFVDICRNRFDVVLMNPPFGDATKLLADYVALQYATTKLDIYAMFISRSDTLRQPDGVVGAILPRTGLFIGTMGEMRSELLLDRLPLCMLADLGRDVLDEATIRTACYCMGAFVERHLTALRIGNIDNRQGVLAKLITCVNSATHDQDIFVRERDYFRLFPSISIAYWIPPELATRFSSLPLVSDLADVRQGIATGDNFRFLRSYSEVPPAQSDYRPYSKGGEPVEYYDDFDLHVFWAEDGKAIKERAAREYGSASRTVKNEETFGVPGITYSQVNDARLKFRLHPRGAIYDMKGPVVFPRQGVDLWSLLGLLNSSAVEDLMRMSTDGRQWHPTALKRIPVPQLSVGAGAELSELAKRAVGLQRAKLINDETGHFYVSPVARFFADAEGAVADIQARVDAIVWGAYGASSQHLQVLQRHRDLFLERNYDTALKATSLACDSIHYACGCVVGRWDVRLTCAAEEIPLQDMAFDVVPLCSPAMLQNAIGLPSAPGDVQADYPLDIDWDGVLVDDPEHVDDIVRRVRDVLSIIWKDRAEAIEEEACGILGVKELRDYFRKPGNGGFWMDHVKRYSKSRRKAPIYWLLQSAGKNYALWIYYHRLDKDLLFKALVKYVEPKLKLERDRVEQYRNELLAAGSSGRSAKALERRLADQEDLLSDIQDFHDKLRRAADLRLEPDLNDGVVLNIAPLWELVPWKEAKSYWDELMAGEYEWSSIGKQLREKGIVK